MITWVANDIGRSGDNGVMRYRGLTFLTRDSSLPGGQKLAFLYYMEALFITTQVNLSSPNREQDKDVGVEINQLTCSLYSKDLYYM